MSTKANVIDFPCGALALNSPQYVERPHIELACNQNIQVPGSLTRISAPRYMGKSSLLVRVLANARSLNYRIASINFQSAEASVFDGLPNFLRWFCGAVSQALEVPAELDQYWDEVIGHKLSATLYFEDYLLKSADHPVVLALDELNLVFEYPSIAKDFLPLLRTWHERAKQTPSGPREVGFQKLRTIAVYSTDVDISLDVACSPFNTGLPIELGLFNEKQSQALAQRYNIFIENNQDYQLIRHLVGGHPYLLSVALYYLSKYKVSASRLMAEACSISGIYRQHLQNCLNSLNGRPLLIEAIGKLTNASKPIELRPFITFQLAGLGLITLEGSRCRLSCELYRSFFTKHQLTTNQKLPTMGTSEPLEIVNEGIKTSAHLDGLTQLANRLWFDNQLTSAWQAAIAQKYPVSLITITVDFFTLYNKTYGRLAGDFCLQQVAQIIKRCSRYASDTIARYDDESFVLLLPKTSLIEAEKIARRLSSNIKARKISHTASMIDKKIVTVSIGVAFAIPQHEQSADHLIAAAGEAMYRSEQQGGDRINISPMVGASCQLPQAS